MSNDVGMEEIVFVTFGMQWRWAQLRPYLYSLATTLSLHNMWRLPQGGYEFGGVSYAVGVSVALVCVGLPAVLLQLAMGQLSQQDPVGVWKAVPFFKGVGYLRLLISFICSVYNIVYLALSAAFFLYTLGRSIPFEECFLYDQVSYHSTNASECLKATFLAPVTKKPEYYIALTLIVIVTWSTIPFMLYSPVKFMKRLLFGLAPIALLLGILVQIGAGDEVNLSLFRWGCMHHFWESHLWHSAVTQAFLSTQTAGGFLIAASDPVYSNIDLKRTAIFLVVTNIAACWLSLLFWYSIGSQPLDPSPVAVLTQIYDAAVDRNLHVAWPLMIFAMLVCMGIITVLCFLFPVYERCRRSGGMRWRKVCVLLSVAGTVATQALLYAGLPALHVLQYAVAPFLITLTTTAEILIFFFVYGRKYIVEDIEFLTGRRLNAIWSYSFCVVPSIVLPLWLWWVITISLRSDAWLSRNHVRFTLTICFLLVLGIIVAFALVAVAKQNQYDKRRLKASMRPSKDWGPSDPITHHYWLERKEENKKTVRVPTRSQHRRGSVTSHIYDDVVESIHCTPTPARSTAICHDVRDDQYKLSAKARCNSYDWVYTNKRQSDERLRRRSSRNVRRTHSCDLSSHAHREGGVWDDGLIKQCSTIARLSNSLRKLHSIPIARPPLRRKSTVSNKLTET